MIVTRMAPADLNQKAIDAGTHYVKVKYKDAPLEIRTQLLNAAAHGFGMGVRWHEKELEKSEADCD